MAGRALVPLGHVALASGGLPEERCTAASARAVVEAAGDATEE